MSFTYVDLFAGIGGFRIALDALGGQSLGYAEIDKAALETYQTNFKDPQSHNLGDVQVLKLSKNIDVLVGGVPCQSWSVAGKRLGFNDPRGKLWFDTIELTKQAKPKVFIFENVKGLFDPRNSENLNFLKNSFTDLGYDVYAKLLNSYDFNLPQNRSRIFLVGFRKDQKQFSKLFQYPSPIKKTNLLANYLDGIQVPKINQSKLKNTLNDFFILCDTRNGHSTIHSWDIQSTTKKEKAICQAILTNRRKKAFGIKDGNPLSFETINSLVTNYKITIKDIGKLVTKNILKCNQDKIELVNTKNSAGINNIYRVYLPNASVFSTLTATMSNDYIATRYLNTTNNVAEYKQEFITKILSKNNLRHIKPREAARIQGFPETFKLHDNDNLALKQIGNAISPPVVYHLMKSIIQTQIFDQIKEIPKQNYATQPHLQQTQLITES